MSVEHTASSPPRVTIGPAGLQLIDGESRTDVPLISGALHYFQLPRRVWDRCLDSFVELGLPLLDTYVPWAVHEREPGHYVFDRNEGSDRYARNLGAFLDACAERGLKVVLRPGPHINAELTLFGYPLRILQDRRCLARGARDNPVIMPAPPRFFPVPSYASEQFLDEAGRWLEAVSAFVAPYVWPRGPVVAAQVDNEAALFFRMAAYDQDYHPDAVQLFRSYLRERYGDDLPVAYGAAVEQVVPPRSMNARSARELLPHLDWVAFKEWMVARALERLGGIMRGAGLQDIPLLHNLPATTGACPLSLSAIEQRLDLAGMDLYLPRRDYAAVRRIALQLAGSSRLPTLCELAWGGWLWWFPQSLEDQLANALAALMHGVKGINLYMAVERDRWCGAPIDATGEPRLERFEATRSLIAAIRDVNLPGLSRDVPVGLMRVRDYERLAVCTALVDPLPPMGLALVGLGAAETASEEPFDFEGPIQLEYSQLLCQAEAALDEQQAVYAIVESDAAAEWLQRFKLLIVPSFDFIDGALLARLAAFTAAGGTLVFSPRRPRLDERMQPLTAELPPHVLLDLDELIDALGELVDRHAVEPPLSCAEPRVELTRFGDGDELAIFAANRSDSSCMVAVRGVPTTGRWIWDAVTGAPVNLASLHLEANQVRMLRSRPMPETARQAAAQAGGRSAPRAKDGQ